MNDKVWRGPICELDDSSSVTDPQYAGCARVVVPFQSQVVHEVDLRYAQVVRVRLDLDAREPSEAVREVDLVQPAVDVAPASGDRLCLLCCHNFLPEHCVPSVSCDAECARGNAVESTSEPGRVCMEPVRVH